jgi:hypothetical protein
VLFSICAQVSYADTQSDKLRHVKAAFVLNIAKFVSWPAEVYQARPEQLLMCHYQGDFLGKGFETIRERKVGGRQLLSQPRQSLVDSSECDILLVPEEQLPALSEEAALGFDQPVLTIVDLTSREAEGIAHPGILLALVRDGARIGFEVNLSAVNRTGLQLSSQLLKLANIVRDANTAIESVSPESGDDDNHR